MKLAIVTDSSAFLTDDIRKQVHVLDIPVTFGGETFFEGKNLTLDDFYAYMATSEELPKTSQPSLAAFDELLTRFEEEHYTHVICLFLSSGISGFYQSIQYLIEEHPQLTVAIPDSKITSAPLGTMIASLLRWAEQGDSFETLLDKLEQQIALTTAFILVDDLNHLVKGGRLSNGSALLGNLLSIKPILHFDKDGVIKVFSKIRTEKKAMLNLVDVAKEIADGQPFAISVIHSNAHDKATRLYDMLVPHFSSEQLTIVPFNCVIATHLGEGAVALGLTKIIE